jgi:hypothetical protein
MVDCLLCKHKILSSNPTKKKKNKREKSQSDNRRCHVKTRQTLE